MRTENKRARVRNVAHAMCRGDGVLGEYGKVGELSKQFGMLRVECGGDVWRGEIEKEGRGRILEAFSSSVRRV